MNISKRLLVLLITVSMLLSGSFVQAFAEEETVESASVAVPESVSEEDSEDTKEAEEVKEKEEKEKEEATVEKETASSEEETLDSAEETQKSPEPAESDKQDKKSEETADNKVEEAFTSGKLTFECDEYTVTLEYGKKADIPEGTVLDVREISSDTDDAKEQKEYEEYYDRSLEQLRSEKGGDTIAKLGFARFYDITLVSGGKEIEPGDDVKVTFKYSKDSRESVKEGNKEGDAIRVIHMMESGKNGEIKAKPIEKKDTDLTLDKKELTEAAFTTDSFSVYGIVYTVDFEYEGYTYSIPGESEIMLSELFKSLDIEESIKDVKNVEFTDYSLIKIERSGEDWKLISLKPFSTEEKLTVTLEDKIIEIKVTDAQRNNTFILYRNESELEFFSTRVFSSRAGVTPVQVGSSDASRYSDGTYGWQSFDTILNDYYNDYSGGRYSVVSAKDEATNISLWAAGFNATALGAPHGAFGLYTERTYGRIANGSGIDYDLDIYVNDNSMPVQIYVDGNRQTNDIYLNTEEKSYTSKDIAEAFNYTIGNNGYIVDSSSINNQAVNSVLLSELTGTSLAGKPFTQGNTNVVIDLAVVYSFTAFSYTYPKAYKWTYNNGTAVGDNAFVINLETPIARVSNDGGNTWTYHSYLINNGTQGDGVTRKGAFDQANSMDGDVIVEMLYDAHERYTLDDGYTFNNSRISSLTINGTGSKSTLVKNQTTAPMITTTGIKTVKFSNIVFDGKDNNTPNGNGGAVNTNAETLRVSACEFNNCQAGLQGGGIYHNNKGASVEIKGTTFNSCCANGTDDPKAGGGGIFTNALELRVTESEFNDIESKKQGAGIFHKRDKNDDPNKKTLTAISGCKFNNCEAAWSGGGLETDAFNITINETEFNECKGVKGGAFNVYVDGQETSQGSKLTVTSCKFESCGCSGNATSHGGAIRSTSFETNITGSSFNKCTSTQSGGAVACTNKNGSTGITNCNFSECSAKDGGAISSIGKILTVTDGSIKECSASGKGGGINFRANENDNPTVDTTLTVNGCTFDNCTAGDNGGAVRSTALNMNLNGASFTTCTSSKANGGAAANTSTNGTAVITNCTFNDCHADKGNGGACYTNGKNLNMSSGTISGCSATKGGAIYSTSQITMTGGTVTENTTSGDSAALDAEKEKPGFYFQGNVVIKDNKGKDGEARDVYIGTDTDQHIQINSPGLGSSASIGVYVADTNYAYENHGKPSKQFAKSEDGVLAASLSNLDKLFNDRHGDLHGMAAVEGSGNNWKYRIMWPGETLVAPTKVSLRMMPYILILIGGAVLVLMKKVSDRRRKTENEGDQDS